MQKRLYLASTIVVVLFIAACGGGGGGGGGSSSSCDPGATQECVCSGGGDGTQTCLDDGSGWGECDCGSEDDSNSDAESDLQCIPDEPSYFTCNDDGDLALYDECDEEMYVVEDCDDEHGTCQDGGCGCEAGWFGDTCDECRIYVDASGGSDDNGGTAWDDAFATLQVGIDAAVDNGCEIWVAEGTYYPTEARTADDILSKSFVLSEDLLIYGGFAGTETSTDERDIEAHPSVLDGDITTSASYYTERVYQVVIGAEGALLDGFEITNGMATCDDIDNCYTGSGLSLVDADMTVENCVFKENVQYTIVTATNAAGGAVSVSGGHLTLRNTRFSDNSSTGSGGAMSCDDGAMTIEACQFENNTSEGYGGAVYAWCAGDISGSSFVGNESTDWDGGACYLRASSGESISVSDSEFIGNSAGSFGGAVVNREGDVSLEACLFEENTAGYGGGLYSKTGGEIRNSRFLNNEADSLHGGAMWVTFVDSDGLTVSNTVFFGNSASDSGGALYIDGDEDTGTTPVFLKNVTLSQNSASAGAALYTDDVLLDVCNSIIWRNGSEYLTGIESTWTDASHGNHDISYSVVYRGCSEVENTTCGDGNLEDDPLFVNALEGDARLRFDSPALDHGLTEEAPQLDIDGNARYDVPDVTNFVSDGISDLGAFEYDGTAVLTRATGYDTTATAIFTKPLAVLGDAEFSVDNGIGVLSAELDATGYRVTLSLDDALVFGTTYTLSVNGVTDTEGIAVPDGTTVSFEPYTIFIDETFEDGTVPDSWYSWDDFYANINDPSNWYAADGVLYQASNIYGVDGDKRYGTYMMMTAEYNQTPEDYGMRQFLSVDIESGDNDGLGVVFRCGNGKFKIDLDSERSFSRLYHINGDGDEHTILAESSTLPYTPNVSFNLSVEMAGSEIWAFIDGESIFDGPVTSDLNPPPYLDGADHVVGLYTWGSGDDGAVKFDNVKMLFIP